MSDTDPLPLLPARAADAHKGDAGKVAVVAGSASAQRMIGAAALVARGAFRAGAGLVRLAMPAPVIDFGLVLEPSSTGVAMPVDDEGSLIPHRATQTVDELCAQSDVLAIGPGMGATGAGEGTQAAALRAIQQLEAPAVIDADAINALSGLSELTREVRGACVFTPHPGEFDRLAQAVQLRQRALPGADRAQAAEALAQRLGAIVVLKGSGTIVSDGHRTWTCPHGHPCLATAGTGDVLTGVIAGVIAQHAMPLSLMSLPEPARSAMGGGGRLSLYDCVRIAVAAHAQAGELWAQKERSESGLLARELADLVPQALSTMRAGRAMPG